MSWLGPALAALRTVEALAGPHGYPSDPPTVPVTHSGSQAPIPPRPKPIRPPMGADDARFWAEHATRIRNRLGIA